MQLFAINLCQSEYGINKHYVIMSYAAATGVFCCIWQCLPLDNCLPAPLTLLCKCAAPSFAVSTVVAFVGALDN